MMNLFVSLEGDISAKNDEEWEKERDSQLAMLLSAPVTPPLRRAEFDKTTHETVSVRRMVVDFFIY